MKNEEDSSLYRQIMKGTAVFGGSQFLTMFINIVKGKLVAIILRDYGMGISSLMQSALMPMQQLFSFGLPTAGVRDIAAETDAEKKAEAVMAFRRVLFVLAFLGMCTMAIGAMLFSVSTFGDASHTLWFVEMAVALLFFILQTGENSILQGYRQLKTLALCNIVGALCGLLFGVPLYWYLGIEGIVPSMIILSFTTWCFSRYFTRRMGIAHVRQTWHETWTWGRRMLLLGGAMMLAGLFGTLSTYFVNTFIRSFGTIADIGLFQAANMIVLQSTSLVFSAMATDYFPHLSSLIDNRSESSRLVEKEGEIVILIMLPIISLLILFAPLIVRILLTPQFDSIVPLIRLMSISFVARAWCFPLDYVCLARGDKSFFFWVDGVFTNVKTFLLYVAGYYLFGLIGLGYAIVANALIDILCSTLLNKWRYNITYSTDILKVLLPMFLLCIFSLTVSFLLNDVVCYTIMGISATIVCTWSYIQLNKRIGIKELFTHGKS